MNISLYTRSKTRDSSQVFAKFPMFTAALFTTDKIWMRLFIKLSVAQSSKDPACNAGDAVRAVGLIPGSGKIP